MVSKMRSRQKLAIVGDYLTEQTAEVIVYKHRIQR